MQLQRRIQNPVQMSKMERFVKIVNYWKLLTIFAKHSILEVWKISEYASELSQKFSSRLTQQYTGIKVFMAYPWAVKKQLQSISRSSGS